MLVLRESHQLMGLHEDDFEDSIRDEWMPTLARTDGVRLLYYLKVAHGSGASYNVITYTLFRDGRAWDELLRRTHDGDLATYMSRLDGMRREVESKFLLPLPWSPMQELDLGAIPVDAAEHEATLFMEDTVWPYEGKLEEYIEKSGAMYAKEFVKPPEEKEKQVLDIQASFRTTFGSHRRREIILWQKVLNPKFLLPLFQHEMPKKYKQPGLWMLDALQLRDQWQSKLLRTASWSPLY